MTNKEMPTSAVIYFVDGVVDVNRSQAVTAFGEDYAACIFAFRATFPLASIWGPVNPDVCPDHKA